jgi:primosomal protein N' (replication factor Y)
VIQAGAVVPVKPKKISTKKPTTQPRSTPTLINPSSVSRDRLPVLRKTTTRILASSTPVVIRYSRADEPVAIATLLAAKLPQLLILVPHDEALRWWQVRLHHLAPVIYSSQLKLTEQRQVHQQVRSGQAKVVIGTRGAVFLPPDTWNGILVIDEDNTSYHQDQNPRFQAVELATWLSQRLDIPCALLSLSPRIATAYRFPLVDITLPPITPLHVIDLQAWWTSGQTGLLSDSFLAWIQNHTPAVLVYNRKGEFRWLRCQDCKQLCPLGSTTCPHCQSIRLKPSGMGNQKIEQVLHHLLPQLNIQRWDADFPTPPTTCDLLLTTNYGISRLEWKNFKGIGVISVDHQLAIPDFRSNERVLSLLTQLMRTDLPVSVQTTSPSHLVMTAAKTQEYTSFYAAELEVRKRLSYPPFGQIVDLIQTQTKQKQTRKFSLQDPLPTPPDNVVLDILE